MADFMQVMNKAKARLLDVQKESIRQLALEPLTDNTLSPKGNAALWGDKKFAKWAIAHGYGDGHGSGIGGNFIANWQLTTDIGYTGEFFKKEGKNYPILPASPEDFAYNNILKSVNEITHVGGTYILINNKSYASRLNHGWSSQASAILLDRIALNWQSAVDRAVEVVNL